MRIAIVTQARMGSSRLPEKVVKKVDDKYLLQIHLERILRSKFSSNLILATTIDPADQKIEEIGDCLGVSVFRGSVDNVLDRFYQATRYLRPDFVVRLTSDCPLIDPNLINELLEEALKLDLDYYSNTLVESYPDGQDIEVIKFSALEIAWKSAKLKSEKEHVTPYIINNSTFRKGHTFTAKNHLNLVNYGMVRMTVDQKEDFVVIEKLIQALGTEGSWREYANYYLENDTIHSMNASIVRNEGLEKSQKNDSK